MLVHASCVEIGGQAVLLLGDSGSGKSDVAVRLIDSGAALVSDDQTELKREGDSLIASPPSTIAGMIEMRQAGILRLDYKEQVPVKLCVDLVTTNDSLERFPKPFYNSFLDCSIRSLRLSAYEASTPAKIRLALKGNFVDE